MDYKLINSHMVFEEYKTKSKAGKTPPDVLLPQIAHSISIFLSSSTTGAS